MDFSAFTAPVILEGGKYVRAHRFLAPFDRQHSALGRSHTRVPVLPPPILVGW